MTADAAAPAADPTAPPARRRWWQRLPMLLLVGVVPLPFGFFFLGFVAIALLFSDLTRESEVRAGGGVLLFWWAYSFREGDTSPYLAAALLAIAAALLARGWRRRVERGGGLRGSWGPLAGAVLAAVLAVLVLVPYGYRSSEITREDAARRTFEARAARPWTGLVATDYLVDPGRLRVIHKPVWYVAVYERHASVPTTADGQPCFTRREVWRVDGLDGTVSRATSDDAKVGGDPCLPIKLGTARDLKPAPR
ncbi:MAG TPA: hypothetical protein VF519_04065 [Mycobacteriales bacterium]